MLTLLLYHKQLIMNSKQELGSIADLHFPVILRESKRSCRKPIVIDFSTFGAKYMSWRIKLFLPFFDEIISHGEHAQ